MATQFTVRHAGEITIFDITGRMVAGNEGQKLHTALIEAFDEGHHFLLLNCAGLAFVDSSGVGDLVSSLAEIASRGGAARLLGPAKGLADMLSRTRLDSLIDIYPDEATAIASFTPENNARTQQKLAGLRRHA
jgi:anti-sigma B factor antagonist